MTNYEFEIGENKSDSTCHCCGRRSCVGHGFVSKNKDAYAVYYAGWSEDHPYRKVNIALAIGDWDEDSTTDNRTCFGLEVLEDGDEISFKIVEPTESPWSNTDLLGPMLTRVEGLSHPLLKEVFLITENILRNHIALREYLAIP